jgi:excisionase family DNA binding protein
MNRLTPRQVAKRYGISVPTVYRWVREGQLPAVRLGKRVLRFDKDAIDQWELEKHKPECRSCGLRSYFAVQGGLCLKCRETPV